MSKDSKKKKLLKKVSEVINVKKDEDKLPISNKKVKNLNSTRTQIRIKNVLKPKVQKTTSPKKQVETHLEKNIVIPQQNFTSLKHK